LAAAVTGALAFAEADTSGQSGALRMSDVIEPLLTVVNGVAQRNL
jgi:hypothetical protein